MSVSNQKYMDNGGDRCPLCDSGDITASAEDIEDISYNTTAQYCRCNSCGAAWNNCYTFTGIADVVDKDGNEIEVNYD